MNTNYIKRNYYAALIQDDQVYKHEVIYNYAGDPVGEMVLARWKREKEPNFYSYSKFFSRDRIKQIYANITAHSFSDLITERRKDN